MSASEPDSEVTLEVGEVAKGADSAQVEVRAGSMGEAKWAAMKELELSYPGLQVDHVSFDVLEEGGESARVAATADLSAWQKAASEFEWPDEPAERVREVLRRITSHLGLRASVDVEQREDGLWAAISGSELGILIGRHGQTIDAIQSLCAQAAYRGLEDRGRVTVDAGGYRERREASLRRQADRGASDAVRFGRPVELDSMSAAERRIVHIYLRERTDVETHSEGDDPYRRIVISPGGLGAGG